MGGAEGGAGGGLGGGVGHHCLCSARPPLQVKEHGGGATGVTDLTFVCVCWMVLGWVVGGVGSRGLEKKVGEGGVS